MTEPKPIGYYVRLAREARLEREEKDENIAMLIHASLRPTPHQPDDLKAERDGASGTVRNRGKLIAVYSVFDQRITVSDVECADLEAALTRIGKLIDEDLSAPIPQPRRFAPLQTHATR